MPTPAETLAKHRATAKRASLELAMLAKLRLEAGIGSDEDHKVELINK